MPSQQQNDLQPILMSFLNDLEHLKRGLSRRSGNFQDKIFPYNKYHRKNIKTTENFIKKVQEKLIEIKNTLKGIEKVNSDVKNTPIFNHVNQYFKAFENQFDSFKKRFDLIILQRPILIIILRDLRNFSQGLNKRLSNFQNLITIHTSNFKRQKKRIEDFVQVFYERLNIKKTQIEILIESILEENPDIKQEILQFSNYVDQYLKASEKQYEELGKLLDFFNKKSSARSLNPQSISSDSRALFPYKVKQTVFNENLPNAPSIILQVFNHDANETFKPDAHLSNSSEKEAFGRSSSQQDDLISNASFGINHSVESGVSDYSSSTAELNLPPQKRFLQRFVQEVKEKQKDLSLNSPEKKGLPTADRFDDCRVETLEKRGSLTLLVKPLAKRKTAEKTKGPKKGIGI